MLAFASLSAASVHAQAIRGSVVDRGDVPVPGVVIQLLDSGSRVGARAISNVRGEFQLVAKAEGSYRVATLRIGFRPMTSDVIVLRAGDIVTHRLILTDVQLSLDTIRIVAHSACQSTSDSTVAVFAVWEQVRAALTATQVTAGTGSGPSSLAATVVGYERLYDPSLTHIRTQTSVVRTGYVTQPWASPSPETLHNTGYVITGADDSVTYRAPGIDALLAPTFLGDHCFKLVSSRDEHQIGLEFEPSLDRRQVAEIRGTLWLDRTSSELRRLEFAYVNIARNQPARAGGDMDFVRFRDGGWAISRWNIRMPVLGHYGGLVSRSEVRVTDLKVSGGELAVARRGNDTLWSRPTLTLSGTVTDSMTRAPVAGAQVTVRGTRLESPTDARGRFAIDGVLFGDYILDVRTPTLSALGAISQVPVSFSDSTTLIDVRLPSADQVASAVCGGLKLAGASREGFVVGRVELRKDSVVPRNVRVSAEWATINASRNDEPRSEQSARSLSGRVDARGTFRICGVPIEWPLVIRATADSMRSATVSIRIPTGQRFARAELMLDPALKPVAAFAGIVLSDSVEQPLAGAEVALPDLERGVLTDNTGGFRFTDVPAGRHRVLVRRLGFGALDTTIAFAADDAVMRRVFLRRIATLDSVIVRAERSDRALRDFDDNRRIGLGHFLVREDLAKMEGRTMASIIGQFPGAALVNGKGTKAWLSTTRYRSHCQPRNLQCILREQLYYIPDKTEAAEGMRVACYAQVYLDNMIMTQGPPTEPFDLSSIAQSQIEAIEYYSNPAQTPAKYSKLGATCGVLVIHTRRSM